MKDKRNISFFILFILYIFIFFLGYSYIGGNVVYASLPLVFAASLLYGNAVALLVIALNIPATLAMFVLLGNSVASASSLIVPFHFLTQCVVAAIPQVVKIYNQKKALIESRKIQNQISKLMDKLNDEKEENEELKKTLANLRIELARLKSNEIDFLNKDPLTKTYNRMAILRKIEDLKVSSKEKAVILIKCNQLKKINETQGIYKGDAYLLQMTKQLAAFSDIIGRISSSGFLIVVDKKELNKIVEEISSIYVDVTVSGRELLPETEIDKLLLLLEKGE